MLKQNISIDGASFQTHKFNTLFGTATVTIIITFLLLLSDTIIVGHFVGPMGVVGISVVTPILSAGVFLAEIVGGGTAYVYSRCIGEFKKDEADRVFGQGIITVVVITCLMALAFMLFSDTYFNYMGLSDAARIEVENYWAFEKYVILIYPIHYLLSETVYMNGDELICNISNFVLIFGNIGFSVIFCALLGTKGASLGTFLGTFLCTAIFGIHFLRKSNTIKAVFSFKKQILAETIFLSITDAMPYLCWGLLDFFLNKIIISRYTDAYIPILTMVINFLEVTMIFDGVGEAMAPLAEVYMGEENYSGEKSLAKHGLRVAVVEGIVLFELVFILAPLVPALYGLTDPLLVPYAEMAIRIFAFSMPFASLLFFFTSQFRIVRKIKLSVYETLCAQFILIVAFTLIFSDKFGLSGIWASFAISYAATLLIFGVGVFLKFGKSSFPWLCPKDEGVWLNCSFILSRQNVIAACEKLDEFMRINRVPEAIRMKADLILEETGILTYENNKFKESFAEYTVNIREESLYIITRDTAELDDLTQTRGQIDDVQKYMIEKIMSRLQNKQYLTTAGFNRCYYRIPFVKEGQKAADEQCELNGKI